MGVPSRISVLLCIVLAALVALASAKVHVSEVAIRVASASGPKLTQTLKYPKQLDDIVAVEVDEQLSISALTKDDNGKGLDSRATFVTFVHAGSQLPTTLVLESPSGAAGLRKIDLTLGSKAIQETFKGQPGVYAVAISVGRFDQAGVVYPIGNVNLSFPADPEFFVKHSYGEHYGPLPEIHHVFRPDEKQPLPLISQVFALLSIAPWVLLLGAWSFLGANVRELFASVGHSVFGVAFIGTFVSWFTLFYFYWVRLNLFQFLGYGSVLAVATLIIGRQALVLRHNRRIAGNK
ncbi:Dolichyl-diphosphooligosaccharide--protein glycosyltransferase subunit Swp1 [Polychytrium aggregatum]|uniref:Dolichyl-diphosphooligosaccharide--protein glycosyltransferase subunit Swp1 n=1 Tax=Polychytrium aggregatum TaxID=110093 RepID=UPI0022FE546B|nr:Dolichyl-diphosphooligosaccharide--protein glycosyltransferase subunit Swp1 [Polychytrium aggregatum]KAI9205013.1 Dolichyl-diphosphooligosaccharide--protein glycosyltransferase subunit Swp1 [Polychytrium aggregatum]